MQWIDALNPASLDNENLEDATGLPFCKTGSFYPDHYSWGMSDVTFRRLLDFQSFLFAFSLRYRYRIPTGQFSEYGAEDGYHVFHSDHPYLILHFRCPFHPLAWKGGSIELEAVDLFSPNREILQLVLKGIRVCAMIGNEMNYSE